MTKSGLQRTLNFILSQMISQLWPNFWLSQSQVDANTWYRRAIAKLFSFLTLLFLRNASLLSRLFVTSSRQSLPHCSINYRIYLIFDWQTWKQAIIKYFKHKLFYFWTSSQFQTEFFFQLLRLYTYTSFAINLILPLSERRKPWKEFCYWFYLHTVFTLSAFSFPAVCFHMGFRVHQRDHLDKFLLFFAQWVKCFF